MHFNYDVVMIPLQLIIVFFTIYYFVVSWFGLFGKMRETKQFPEKSTFALIVCAHNEQQVIAKLVENLKQLNYSDKLTFQRNGEGQRLCHGMDVPPPVRSGTPVRRSLCV